jgi:MFS-type transporter involved in bile tolerance (Atg22 family)
MHIISRVLVLLLNMVLSLVLIAWGWYGPGLADGLPEKKPLQLTIGLLLLPTLIMLWIFGKSKKRIDNLFWYLGLGFPLFILVWLFIG